MPAYTTIAKVRDIVFHLTSLSDSSLQIIIDDAALEVDGLILLTEFQTDPHKERLNRYLAIHLASLKPQDVVKEKLDILERVYSASGQGLDATPYGQEYVRMVRKYTSAGGIKFF